MFSLTIWQKQPNNMELFTYISLLASKNLDIYLIISHLFTTFVPKFIVLAKAPILLKK